MRGLRNAYTQIYLVCHVDSIEDATDAVITVDTIIKEVRRTADADLDA